MNGSHTVPVEVSAEPAQHFNYPPEEDGSAHGDRAEGCGSICGGITKRMHSIAYCLLPIAYCLFSVAAAQTIDSASYDQYKFINKNINKIENDSTSLKGFYEKLYQLNQTKFGRVNVVHIGDSHIQADHFSGAIRQKLQLK